MRGRAGKGGRRPILPPFEGVEDPDSLYNHMLRYLTHMGVMGQSPHSVLSSKVSLRRFILWCQERGVARPSQVDRPMVEQFQRSLFQHRKTNGEPLSARSFDALQNSPWAALQKSTTLRCWPPMSLSM